MSDQTNVYKLKEILERSDKELTGNWSRLASLIKNYEKMEWRDAQKLASLLIKDGKAAKYVADVRKKTNSKKNKTTARKKSSVKKQKQTKVIPINTKRDRFSMNYKRLLKIVPDLIERLENGEEVYGKSVKTGYDDFNIELIYRDNTGYYLAISHYYKQNGDMVADPDMRILLNSENETIEALSFQNALYYRSVYNDIYERKLVDPKEKKAQNAFLESWLKNLIAQEQFVEWKHERITLVGTTEEKGGNNPKPDISYMDETLIAEPQRLAKEGILDEIIELYTNHQDGKQILAPIALYFIVDRINSSPLTGGNNYFKYPTQQELKDDYERIKAFKEREEEIDKLSGMKKPDISFVPKALNKAIGELMEKTTIKEAKRAYAAHEKGQQKLDALALFYIAEKLNEHDQLADIPYPKEAEIRAYVKSLRPQGYDKIMSELKEEIELTENFVFGPLTFKVNYEKLLKIAPTLIENLPENGKLEKPIGGTSKLKTNDLNLLIMEAYNDGFLINILESKGKGDNYTFGLLMTVFLDPKAKELIAMATYANSKDSVQVYGNLKTFEQVDPKEEKEQNSTLGKWLDELYKQGHQIKELKSIVPETGQEEIKTPVKQKPEQKVIRLEKANYNQLLKTNFQKLIRLIPDLFELKLRHSEIFENVKDEGDYFQVMALEMKGEFAHVFEIKEGQTNEVWTIHVQRTVGKAFAKSYGPMEVSEDHIPAKERNKNFGNWLSKKLKKEYKTPEQIRQELLNKFPIVLEWTEGAADENVGFHSLEKLRTRLKSYGFTESPEFTYIKNKLWFRGYPSYVRIDLSLAEHDYNPNEQDLLEWLNQYDSNFDWSQFSRPRAKKKEKTPAKKSRKELQKEVENEIPDFKPGEVKLMPAHIKRGIKQKHIDWINKNKQGMTVVPINRMVNNTKSFGSDLIKKAKKPGFRISRTGKLYYETRSNRSDITGKNL